MKSIVVSFAHIAENEQIKRWAANGNNSGDEGMVRASPNVKNKTQRKEKRERVQKKERERKRIIQRKIKT